MLGLGAATSGGLCVEVRPRPAGQHCHMKERSWRNVVFPVVLVYSIPRRPEVTHRGHFCKGISSFDSYQIKDSRAK